MINKDAFLKIAKWVLENCSQDSTTDNSWVDYGDNETGEYSDLDDDKFYEKYLRFINDDV